MIVDYTAEEKRKAEELDELFNTIEHYREELNGMEESSAEYEKLNKKINKLVKKHAEEWNEFCDSVEQSRFKLLNNNPSAIMDNAAEETDTVIMVYRSSPLFKGEFEKLPYTRDQFIESVKAQIKLHYQFFKDDKEALNRLDSMVLNKVRKSGLIFSENETAKSTLEKDYPLMYTSRYFGTMAKMSKADRDPYSERNLFKRDGLQILHPLETFEGLDIRTHKLLSIALLEFTKKNSIAALNNNTVNYSVTIPFKDFAKKMGIDITEKAMPTPEEQEAEHKRAENNINTAYNRIKKSLNNLSQMQIQGKEKVKINGKSQEVKYGFVNLFESGTLNRSGNIELTFGRKFGDTLFNFPLNFYPTQLLAVDNRNNNAYTIGLALARHYSIPHNHEKKTADKITVKAVLNETTLDINHILKTDRSHWERRIKEPLLNALDELVNTNVLIDYSFEKAGGNELTDEEYRSITQYEDFANLLVHFTLYDKKQIDNYIENWNQKKKERKAEARKRRQKRKSAKAETEEKKQG